jgi:hypothetical protein
MEGIKVYTLRELLALPDPPKRKPKRTKKTK